MNRQTEIENIIRTLWNIDDVTIDAESKNAIKKALQSLQDVRMTLKKENDNFKNVRGIGSSKKPIKSADKHFNYDEYLGDIYDSDRSNADNWSREEYNDMVETARGIFYPAVQKAANACHFTVSDNEAEYVAEKCVRCFFDNASWDEAVNRPEEYYVNSSRKSIKSDSDWHARNDYQNKEIYREAFASLVKDSDAQDFDNSPYGTVHYPGFYRVLVDGTYETEFSAETDEEAIQKFKDYFAESRGINNSKKSIKSSLEDRLVPYLEEFEEGYADALTSTDEMGHNARLETFYEMFKSDYNLTDDDINKLEGAVQDIWHETEEENAEHDMGEMYGAPHGATPDEALRHFE